MLAVYAVWQVGRPLASLCGRSHAWRRGMYRRWGRGLCRLMGMRTEVRGERPALPCILISNHLGYVDIALIAAELGAMFVSKAEVRDWPLIGRLSADIGTVFVQREKRRELPDVNLAIEAALARGDGIVVFAEGRSTQGDGVLPFRASLLAPAASGRHPVHCIAVHYETRAGDPRPQEVVSWWDETPFLAHALRLLRLPWFCGRIAVAPRVLADPDRKVLAERAWREVSALYSAGDASDRVAPAPRMPVQ